MAKKAGNTQTVSQKRRKPKVKRKGIHAKTKTANSKKSKHYVKKYVGQGH